MTQQVELACRNADLGRFDTAVEILLGIREEQLEFAGGRSLIASVYRQIGRHDLAAGYDAQGLQRGRRDALGRAMCALGAAADRVGVADLPGACGRLAEARPMVAAVPVVHWALRWFDPWLTQAWVDAEVHLLGDEPVAAVEVLEPFARQRPRGVPNTRWPYERTKTWLFLGVAQRCAGRTEDAVASLQRAASIAADARLAPLLVPAFEQLRSLSAPLAQPYAARAEQAIALLARHQPAS